MASPRRLLSLFLLFQFLLFASSLSVKLHPLRVSSSAYPKVSLALYYETLCPYCSNFIVNHLVKIFDKGLIDIIDLNLVPYGNARLEGNDTITCQHGEFECLLNTVEACAINVWPDLNKHFTFIYCVESLVLEGKYREWESCFGKMGLDPKPIADCYSSGYGKQLELKYANETNALHPPHTYVPWVTVDREPLFENYENFVAKICKAYKGSTLPKACRELLPEIVPKAAKSNQMLKVSYAEETSPTTKIRSPVTS